ncbi:MAG: M28 family metallopeptidase [Bacteroidota bacterium]
MRHLTSIFWIFLFGIALGFSQEKSISVTEIQEMTEQLASDEFQGRDTGTKGIELAASYIENQFRKNEIAPFYKTYRDSFQVKNKSAYNIVAQIEGTDPALKDEKIIIGAHYDHIGFETEIDNDSIANGANDNASGTVATLSLAKYFAKNPPKRTLVFALFSAEELGLLGSKHLAKRMKAENQEIYLMFNIEMVGVPMENTNYQAYFTGFNKSNFGEVFNEYAGQEVLGFFEKANEFQLFQRSDNYPFYEEFGIPAQTACTFDFSNYPYYHHVKDEAQFLDFEHMSKLIESFINGIEGIANSKEREIKWNENE